MKTLKELQEEYELELDKIISEIEKRKAERVLLQFPDGLKQYAVLIADYLYEKSDGNVEFFIWLGSCYGACDVPNSDADLIVQFGHGDWN